MSNKSGKIIKLSNVISAEGIATNLLSLRKLVEIGLHVHLDNKKIRVFDPETEENFIIGDYVEPNWLITFQKLKSEKNEFQNYNCTAKLVSLDDFSKQQTDTVDTSTSEGEDKQHNPGDNRSVFGRKDECEISCNDKNNKSEFFIDTDLDQIKLNRRIIDLNNLTSCEE